MMITRSKKNKYDRDGGDSNHVVEKTIYTKRVQRSWDHSNHNSVTWKHQLQEFCCTKNLEQN